jgi:sialate O-acetylesterase
MKKHILTLTALLSIVFLNIAYAQELKPNSLFCDGMVLQQNMPVPVWGTAKPNQKIKVTFGKQKATTTADNNGKWSVKLNPLKASKVGREMIISGGNKIKISNILVGEVWICSGQSNMQFNTDKVPEIESLIPFAKNIRTFEVKRQVSFKEKENAKGEWTTTNPSSAVAFGFAYFLESIGDVPVGIILSSWGSSSIEAWMPRDLENDLPYFKSIMEDFDEDLATKNRLSEAINSPEGWNNKEDIFMRRQPNIIYNAMMKPLAPFACRGLVWYQGERNTRYLTGVPEVTDDNWFHRVVGIKEYGDVLKLWIDRYRKEWNNKNMHFAIVMLPGYGKGTANSPQIDSKSPTEESWAWMRESQLKALELPNTSVVNTIDLGSETNVHPTDKFPIGQRLALLAARYTLNKNIVAEGPVFDTVEKDNNTLIVHFKNSEGLKTNNKEKLSGFWIADKSLNWQMAEAKINGETVILKNENIKTPEYIRYAFAGKPDVNLVNAAGLPAYPFRTDL